MDLPSRGDVTITAAGATHIPRFIHERAHRPSVRNSPGTAPGRPAVDVDAPGETQMVDSVIDAMTEYPPTINSNSNRVFSISRCRRLRRHSSRCQRLPSSAS